MPGVALQPPSPAPGVPGSLQTTMHNGAPVYNDNMSVAEIKERAKEHAQKVARGASAMSLLRSARSLSTVAQECELSGDLKGALSSYTKVGSLAQMFMNTVEFKAEAQPGKRGVLHREFMDFQQHDGKDLKERVDQLESKLFDLERSSANNVDPEVGSDEPTTRIGSSIADRLRSLQDAGLAVGTTKRFSRETPDLPTPPMSPDARRNRFSVPVSSSSPLHVPSVVPPSASPPAPSPHAIVPPSSFGPPSPSSDESSSPRLSQFNLTEFAQTFPSIDELDEMESLKLPHVPNGTGSSVSSQLSSISRDLNQNPPASAAMKSFPALSIDPGPRPSSTPITPTRNAFLSRPASPSRSPNLSAKMSTLGLSSSPLAPRYAMPNSPLPEKPSLPMSNTIAPKLLHEYMYKLNFKTLMIDVRTRAEFNREHIKADAIVCIEPSVLMRGNVTGESLEDSLHVAPRDEWALFCNRDKFDLIAIYDAASESFDSPSGPLSSLVRAIYEQSFRKILRHTPVLLIGGLKNWKQDVGIEEVASELTSFGDVTDLPALRSHDTPMSPSFPSRSRISEIPQSWSDHGTKGFDDLPNGNANLIRRPTVSRTSSKSISYGRDLAENISVPPTIAESIVNVPSSIQYPNFPRTLTPTASGSSSFSSSQTSFGLVSVPPQASINASPLARRRSDYMDQSQTTLSALGARSPVDYPDLSSHSILRPPPPVASPVSERQDSRPRMMHGQSFSVSAPQSKAGPKPPTISSDYPVTHWSDMQISTTGLKNLGNTCYMNSTIQCLAATVPFARFFTDGRWKSAVNMLNPLGTKGALAQAFSSILYDMSHSEFSTLNPLPFRRSVCSYAPQFSGADQHDSQEFLSFLLDGLHEDLNRVLQKPAVEPTPEREAELERLPQQIASEQEWALYRMRNDSLVVDFFQGQFRSRLECLTCHKTSTTYNSFMSLSLPIPSSKSTSKVSLQACLDAFVKEEVLEKGEAWHCPNCKTLRKATKLLTLSRLPPILLIHLKRFSVKGPFTDKIETVVDFPLRSLDLTNYMPPPLPPGMDRGQMNGIKSLAANDPRVQLPPYKYDLYGVTNHFGNLSNGHYTAFIASRGGWTYCDDSRVTPTDAKEVVSRAAYVLYYKRTES